MRELPLRVKRARNILLAIFIVGLTQSAVNIFLQKNLIGLVGFLASAGVMYRTMQGYKWAKWTIVSLYLLSGLLLSSLFVSFIGTNAMSNRKLVHLAGTSLISLFISGYMVFSKNLNEYFSAQRAIESVPEEN